MFLHYGPGGNTAVERMWLHDLSPWVDFWEQPSLSGSECTFKNLVNICTEKLVAGSYTGVIGQSFGCDIAQEILSKNTHGIQDLILVSPVRDISRGFANFAEKMGLNKESQLLLHEIAQRKPRGSAAKNGGISPQELQIFWQCVQAIASNPLFVRTYWGNSQRWDEYEMIAANIPPMNFEMWQTMMNDFLIHYPQYPEIQNIQKTVLLGSKDPYFSDIHLEEKSWKNKSYKVVINATSGHYPHLESEDLYEILKPS